MKRIACIGVGLIGTSWASIFATNGFDVIIEDVENAKIKKALRQIKNMITFLVQNSLVNEQDVKRAYDRISATTSISEAVRDADFVQESVFESYDVKKKVFREMDAHAPHNAILASSASALLMSEIQKATAKPERCIVAHPWNPPHLIPLVEVVPGKETSDETVQTTYKLMTDIGKTPIIVKKEVPGFVANRLQAALVREALDLVDKGVASVEDVDRAICAGPGLRWAIMGPFMIMHLGHGGLERFFDVLNYSYSLRWKSMDTWTSLPYSAAKKAIQGLKDELRDRTMEDLVTWRDKKLIQMLQTQKDP